MTITKLCNAIIKLADAGDTFGEAAASFTAQALELANKRTKLLSSEQVAKLGQALADKKGAILKPTALGRVAFDRSTPEGAAAHSMWQRTGSKYDPAPKSARGGATSEQASPVSKLVASFEKLTAAERRKFLRQIGAI